MKWIVAVILLVFSAAWAQADEAYDLVGHWNIVVVDAPESGFSGEITVSSTDDPGRFSGILVTEDSCCDGNYARALQRSEISILGDYVVVLSKIEEFLVLEEPNPGPEYIPDNFDLRWETENSLIGTVNGYTIVRWTRESAGLV